MISSEAVRESLYLKPYGPLTLTESMTEAMAQKAREISRHYHRSEAALLADALGEIGMSLMDLSLKQMNELADVEGSLESQYGINEQDDEYDEERQL
jgi:hypothetical protein